MRRPRLVLSIVSVAATAVAATYLYADRPPAAPPQPGSGPVALVLVAGRPPAVLPGPGPTRDEVEAYRRAQAALVRSEFVLNAALRTPAARDALKPHADPVAFLAGHVTAEFAPGSDVLRIGATGLAPREAAAVANAVAAAYVQEAVQAEVQATRERLRRLEQAQEAIREQLRAGQAAAGKLAGAAGLPPGEADRRAAVAALYQERAALRVEAAKARAAGTEKPFAAELADVDTRIGQAVSSGSALEEVRAELGHLEKVAGEVAAEAIRVRLELDAPARVKVVQAADAGKE